MLETPSEAELAVLRLLTSELSARDIGGRLFLSANTVRTHTRAIYREDRRQLTRRGGGQSDRARPSGRRAITQVIADELTSVEAADEQLQPDQKHAEPEVQGHHQGRRRPTETLHAREDEALLGEHR